MNSDELEDLATQFATQTASFQRVQMGRQVRAALGADVFISDNRISELIDGFAAENAALIQDVPEKMLNDIAMKTTRAIQAGTPHKELAKDLTATFQFAEKRARTIARDQIGKMYAKVNETRFKALGVERYIWRTVGDRRVREEHADLEGREFSFAKGSPVGNPGEPILCRCFAEPIFDEIQGVIDEQAS
jgi:SPP1 gp7 family putative phage head morphogenesis protein